MKCYLKPVTTKLNAGIFALWAAALLFTPAYGDDGKSYPGSMCVRWGGSNEPQLMFSAIGNPDSNSWLFVDCPAIKDDVHKDASINSGIVYVIDKHPSEDVSCNLNSFYRSRDGRWRGWWSPQVSSVTFGAERQSLWFSSLWGNGYTHYYFSCRIPPRSWNGNSYIVSYRIIEN
jgi:hypothetical protein